MPSKGPGRARSSKRRSSGDSGGGDNELLNFSDRQRHGDPAAHDDTNSMGMILDMTSVSTSSSDDSENLSYSREIANVSPTASQQSGKPAKKRVKDSSRRPSSGAARPKPYNARFKDSRGARSKEPPRHDRLGWQHAELSHLSEQQQLKARHVGERRGHGSRTQRHLQDEDNSDNNSVMTEDNYSIDPALAIRPSMAEGVYHQHRNPASFCDQLAATLARSFSQLFRRKCDLAMELLIPIIFFAVTVILWAAWGDNEFDVAYYMDYTSPTFFTSAATLRDVRPLFCYGPGAATPTPGLAPCSASLGTYLCDGDDAEIPLKGDAFCVYNYTFKDLVKGYLFYTQANLTRIPSLDTLILFQWCARKAGSLLRADNFGGSFITNRQFYAIDKTGMLFLAGKDTATLVALEAALANESYYFPMIYGGRFATVSEAKDAMKQFTRSWGIIEVRSFTKTNFDVVIHLAAKGMAETTDAVDITYSGGRQENGADLYLSSGYLTLAERVSEFYLHHVHQYDLGAANYIVSSATPPYKFSPMLRYAYGLVPLICVMAFLYPVSQQTKRIVLEKEMRIREAMLIMGMKDSALYIATFLSDGALVTIVSIVGTALLRATFLAKSDVWSIFLIFWLFALTTIPLSGLMASFFSKARLATLMAPVIYFIIVMPTFIMTSANKATITGFAILSPSGYASMINVLLRHQLGSGFSSEDIHNPNDQPSLSTLLGIVAADFFIYYLLTLYLDAVMPREWGTPKHPLFFIIDPYNALFGKKEKRLYGGADGRSDDGVYEEDDYSYDVVQMEGLRKEYKRGGKSFVAVNNFYWGMCEAEISVLLGHNGAGKTTVLNMMTGMVEPDEGDCLIYGLSVRQELNRVRNEIGFCPQHNILWPELTCRDHLEFYGRIKGLKGWELEDAVCRMLHETDLMDKVDYMSKDLSGGQKRKLSISMAFVGGSRLVFLDEPTAGMDVGARRYLWGMLKSMANYHTIMLTTHFMDEADLLGSRIGIMSQGSLQCSGSSMFLKSHLGVGYSITISVNPETEVVKVDRLVSSYVAGATVLDHNGLELSYQLPMEEATQFPDLLNAVESQDEILGIRGYSLSATTLEEVFLKVSEDKGACDGDFNAKPTILPIWDFEEERNPLRAQARAMFKKRFWNATRDRRMQCFQIICPVVCILVAVVLALIRFNGPAELVLDHATVYAKDKEPANFPTAQCDTWWGEYTTPIERTNHVETHFPNAGQLSEALLDYWFFHKQPTYGAIACQDRNVALFSGDTLANVFVYNHSGPHQAGINLATYYDMIARSYSQNQTRMKFTAGIIYDSKDVVQDPMKMLVTGILIMIPFAFLPSNPVAWVVKERECGARHQQKIAGLNFYVYWGCNFVFDFAAYLIAAILILAIFAIFQKSEFTGSDRIGATIVLFVLYGLTSTAMAYFMSFWFNEHSSAQTATMGGCFALSFLLLIVTYVLQLKPESEDLSNNLRWVFRIVPTFCIGESILHQILLKQLIAAGQATSIWDMQPVGYSLIYLAFELPLFVGLTLLLDHPKLRQKIERLKYNRVAAPDIPTDEDSDVEDERLAVYAAERGGEDTTDVLRVVDLQKCYSNGKKAVKGVTFSIFPCEVFAFLGTNGAGKTTTMSMLCQQFLPSGGSASINGYDIVDESADALRCIGYCPQFDATFDLLTVGEHLNYYAALHGVAESSREEVVSTLLQLCELSKYRESEAAQLSGGNRRKLSVGISLIGGPDVIFLDEPSAGMDPVARRGMWTTIQRASKHCAVVLTTHHLEEVEALADIVAIMVDGTLRCIGDKIHLKNKYGSGFEMSVRVQSEDTCEKVEDFVSQMLPDAVLNEYKSNRYVYALPGDVPLSHVFKLIQQHKDELGITDYCVSQTSIEQVFLKVGEEALHKED